ncbi:hypothetical protein Ancab_011478 [Ancistrocladus abbreviatus]
MNLQGGSCPFPPSALVRQSGIRATALPEDLHWLNECYVGETATSSKSCFDVARLLISTNIPTSISAMIPVSVEGNSFPVFVVEESSGDTIFSWGPDRNRVGLTDRGVPTSEGSSNSTALYSYCHLEANQPSAPLDLPNHNRKLPPSTILVSNDDGHNSPVGFKQAHSNSTTGHFSRKSLMAANSAGRSASPSELPATDVLIDDATSHLLRRENQNVASSKSPQNLAIGHCSSPSSNSCKPISGNSPTSCREASRPTNAPQANKLSKKTKGLKFFHNEPSVAAAKNVSQLTTVAPVPTTESLHDSDIANMNCIFLNKFNAVMVAEIWEVGQQLGLRSEDPDMEVTHHIAKLDA